MMKTTSCQEYRKPECYGCDQVVCLCNALVPEPIIENDLTMVMIPENMYVGETYRIFVNGKPVILKRIE